MTVRHNLIIMLITFLCINIMYYYCMLVAHMWFDYEVQVALGPHISNVSTTTGSYTI